VLYGIFAATPKKRAKSVQKRLTRGMGLLARA
jgi:hypothetical protein